MYKSPEPPPPPRRLPLIAGAIAIACLGYGAAQAAIGMTDAIPLRHLIVPAAAICVTYAILAEYLASSGAYEKDRALDPLACLTCPISGGALMAGLYLTVRSFQFNRNQLAPPPPTALNRLADFIMGHFALFAILPWLAALAIALFCGLRRRSPRPVMVGGIVDQLAADPASSDRAP